MERLRISSINKVKRNKKRTNQNYSTSKTLREIQINLERKVLALTLSSEITENAINNSVKLREESKKLRERKKKLKRTN